ncbi:hypothetical protein GCM10010946_15580 [Undibacterium squillarum]|uniref:Uncharacterized protein n=1 Tax=Undibacterium squillarum TaxID=1131567 RepID=A0ABQ2XYI4_9BURK|nr:hypothetical protein GCM10010946_15580 [Undibacterium squillarum]
MRKLLTEASLPHRHLFAMQSAQMPQTKTKSTGPYKVSGAFLWPFAITARWLSPGIKDAVSAIHADADVNPDRKA